MLEPLREKQERPEMDDFEEKGKKYLKKILGTIFNLSDTLANISAKLSQNIFAYSFVSDHSRHFV